MPASFLRHRGWMVLFAMAAVGALLALVLMSAATSAHAQAGSHHKRAAHVIKHHRQARKATDSTDPASDPNGVNVQDSTPDSPSAAPAGASSGESRGESSGESSTEPAGEAQPAGGGADVQGSTGAADCQGNCVQ